MAIIVCTESSSAKQASRDPFKTARRIDLMASYMSASGVGGQPGRQKGGRLPRIEEFE